VRAQKLMCHNFIKSTKEQKVKKKKMVLYYIDYIYNIDNIN
jgi:pyrroloquinoline quinone (PQQ) biosynthesis protein C